MNIKKAVDLIKKYEGLRLKPYLDPAKIPTIGYGTTYYPDGRRVSLKDPEISILTAEEYLTYDVYEFSQAVDRLVKVPLNSNQYNALVSFAYNVGAGALQKSTLLKKLNAGDYFGASKEFLNWTRAGGKVLPGLVKRRRSEQDLFLTTEQEVIMSIFPATKPKLSQDEVLKIIKKSGVDSSKYPVCLVAIRGYYLNSMGKAGQNDRGLYDDAFFWVTPNGMMSFNGNTDPSSVRKGKGTGKSKGMAQLVDGVWYYKTGIHNGSVPHPAFRQADKVTVKRDGIDQDYFETGWFGINIHRGGNKSTSSLGCQTVPPAQWNAFKELGYGELKRFKQAVFPYILVEQKKV